MASPIKPPELESVDGFVRGRISVIMPAYNEADCIAASVASVMKQFGAICNDLEIIVVDDGSTDKTRETAQSLSGQKIKVVSYDVNQGKGHALKFGFQRATGELTFLVDSDNQIQPKKVLDYVRNLESADIVIGSKRHPLSTVETPVLRRFLSFGFNIIERLMTGVKARDTQAGIKAGKSAALYTILPLLSVKRYAFDAELLTVASLLGFKIRELPVHIRLKATFSVREMFRMMIDLMGIAYRLRVRHWYQKNLARMSSTYKPLIRRR